MKKKYLFVLVTILVLSSALVSNAASLTLTLDKENYYVGVEHHFIWGLILQVI